MDTLGMASDEELPVRAAAHDGAAFGELFERHADAVYNHCFRRCGSWSQAEDLTSGRPWWVDHSSWSFRVAIFLSHLFWVACRRHGPKLWLFDRAWRGETAKDAPGPAHQARGRPQNVVTLERRSRSEAPAKDPILIRGSGPAVGSHADLCVNRSHYGPFSNTKKVCDHVAGRKD